MLDLIVFLKKASFKIKASGQHLVLIYFSDRRHGPTIICENYWKNCAS